MPQKIISSESMHRFQVRDGLIWDGNTSISCPFADSIAFANTFESEGRQVQFLCAEAFVRYYTGKEVFLDSVFRVKKVQELK